jgi:hypothetical protein
MFTSERRTTFRRKLHLPFLSPSECPGRRRKRNNLRQRLNERRVFQTDIGGLVWALTRLLKRPENGIGPIGSPACGVDPTTVAVMQC